MNRYEHRIAELCNPDIDEINLRNIKPATDDELREIESEMGQLPADYREFLRDYGGICLGVNYCRLAALYNLGNQGHRASINFFYNSSELIDMLKDGEKNIPPELITIGEDGNVRLFLAIKGEHAGSVYQWYPSYFPENLYYYPELELVARSFDEFINMLKPLKEQYYNDPEHYKQESLKIGEVVKKLWQVEPRTDNLYSQIMSALGGRYVYVSLGEEARVLSEIELVTLEQEFGHPLPADYREFLRSFGGYSFIPTLHENLYYSSSVAYPYMILTPLRNGMSGQHNGQIGYFHGYMNHDYHDLLAHYQRLKERLPSNLLPIADAGQICLKLSGDGKGAVYQVNTDVAEHSLCPSYGGPHLQLSEENLTLIAPSFDEFMRSLHIRTTGYTKTY